MQKWLSNRWPHTSFVIILAITLLQPACDFTSKIHKRILTAQRLLQDFKYEEAVKEYEKALERIPPSHLQNKILFQLGEIYNLYLNDSDKSVFYFEKIITSTPDIRWKVKAKEKLAALYFDKKNFKKAEKYYKQLCDFVPRLENQDFYQLEHGRSLLEQNNIENSEDVFNQIIREKNHRFNTLAYYYLGMAKFSAKKWKEAISYWREYLRRETKKNKIIETKFLLANTYETMEELQKAYDIYYSLLGEYPNSQVIKNRLQSVYKRRTERKR